MQPGLTCSSSISHDSTQESLALKGYHLVLRLFCNCLSVCLPFLLSAALWQPCSFPARLLTVCSSILWVSAELVIWTLDFCGRERGEGNEGRLVDRPKRKTFPPKHIIQSIFRPCLPARKKCGCQCLSRWQGNARQEQRTLQWLDPCVRGLSEMKFIGH